MARTQSVEEPRDISVRRQRTRASLLLWLLPVPIVGFLLFGSTGRDDAYITYWAADQLRDTGRITNYNGRALEQSSSLLHVLLLAAVSWLTRVSVPTVAPWLAIAAGALCVPVAYLLCGHLDSRSRWVAAALVATLPPLMYWSFGGLETSLATFLVLLALLMIITLAEGGSASRISVAATLVAVVLVRPEMGVVFVAALSIAALLVRLAVPTSWSGKDGCGRDVAARRIFVTALAMAGVACLIAVVRWAYFGAWAPRPVSMKTGVDLELGFRYIRATLKQSRVWISVAVAAVIIAMRWRSLTPGWVIAASLAATGTAAVVGPGGDWMEGGRLLAPWLAVTLVIVGAILGRISASPRVLLVSLLLIANTTGLINYAARLSTGAAAWTHLVWHRETSNVATDTACTKPSRNWFERRNVVHARDFPFVCDADPIFAALARIVAPRRVVYASGQAGMVVYYLQHKATGRGHPFSFVDWNGLTDDTWDRCRGGLAPRRWGKIVPVVAVLDGRCGRLPDVITGIYLPYPGTLGRDPRTLAPEYEPIYKQRNVITSSSWPYGVRTTGTEWLVVRRDLVTKLRTEMRRETQTVPT